MRPLTLIFRRLNRIQSTFWFRVTASVVVLSACAGLFGVLLVKSYSLNSQRQALFLALMNQNINKGDEAAVSLKTSGEVFINGRHYGGPEFLKKPYSLFDANGNIAAVGLLAEELLANQRPGWAPSWLLDQPGTTWMLAIVITAWLLLIVWLNVTLPFALTILGTALPVWLCWIFDAPRLMLGFAGIGVLTFTFVLLTHAALALLQRSNQIAAVAHTVVKEASRTRVALVFIVILLILLPLLPMLLDPDAPLRFRIQSFISYSLGLTFVLAACMTLVLSCASVAFEIRDRQIWQLMTKPLTRLNYLLGKWLGVVVINLIILTVAGVSTFTFIQYLRTLPVAPGQAGIQDVLAVNDEVLTARLSGQPVYDMFSSDDLKMRVDQVISDDPEMSKMERVPVAKRMELARQMQQMYSFVQRSVAPGMLRKFRFTGLKYAKSLNSNLTLRYRFHILGDDEHKTFRAGFVFFDAEDHELQRRQSTFVPTMSHSIPVDPSMIQDDGTLEVGVANLFQAGPDQQEGYGSLNFDEKDFELLYQVASFESNFVRAMAMTWIKLAFLAALGVSCATFLSFPVACLLSFTVFLAGVIGPYLAEAMEWYYPDDSTGIDWSNIGVVVQWVFETITRYIAGAMVFLLSSFGEYRPTEDLVEGRLIRWPSLFIGVLKLGVLWSGLCLGIGYAVLRRRQLAIYSGHG